MKKLILYVVCFALLLGLAGCGKDKYVYGSEKLIMELLQTVR